MKSLCFERLISGTVGGWGPHSVTDTYWFPYIVTFSGSSTEGDLFLPPFSVCSIDKISKVTSPVLVIHGTEDEVIDFSHGLAMYERCPRAVEPLWVEGAGHNDIELYAQYLERLKQFISHELPNSWRQLDFTSWTVNTRVLCFAHALTGQRWWHGATGGSNQAVLDLEVFY